MSVRLRHYVCGSTTHDVGGMFHGAGRGVRRFPSGVFLYDTARGERVLFDTGYAAGEWDTGWRGAAYRRLLPPEVAAEDDIAARLAADDVDPRSITHVVLSHLHPDHVGGVRRFPDAVFVLTEGQERTLAAPRLRDGVLVGLFPDWFPKAHRSVIAEEAFRPTEVGGVTMRAADLLGDGSFLIVDLPGHADGHVGALVENRVLLAGDAAWGRDLLTAAPRMKALPRMVQYDVTSYIGTGSLLQAVADAGIRVVCSHDPLGAKDLL